MNYQRNFNSIVESGTKIDGVRDKLKRYRKCILSFINGNLRILTLLLIGILALVIVILSGLLESLKLNSRHHSISYLLLEEDNSCRNSIFKDNNKWPWLVSIHKLDSMSSSRHFCSGVVISKLFVLSAAHCFKTLNVSDIGVMIDDKLFLVDKLIVHSLYKFTTYSQNDIALIKLEPHDDLMSPICLPDSKIDTSLIEKTVTVASFGDDKTLLKSSNITKLRIINGNKICNSSGFYDENILYCAIDRLGGSNFCNGDGGSPLFSLSGNSWVLFGLASYVTADNQTGIFECLPSFPSYFTKVSKYLDWIKLTKN